jgi:hypothetical protein
MTADVAHPDVARMLLFAYEEIKGSPAHPEDALDAARLAKLPLAPEVLISRMRHVAERNGPGWKPSRLRYFVNPLNDLVKDQPAAKPPPRLSDPAEPPKPLSPEEHEHALAELRRLESPEQRRRADLVATLEPRATVKELVYLLFDRQGSEEFARRLEQCRQQRKQRTG